MGAFDAPSLLTRLLASPFLTLLRPLYTFLLYLRTPPRTRLPSTRPVRVVCISDTHTLTLDDVADGDLLIHAGDMTNDGTLAEIQAQIDWIKTLPHAHKVVIAGNHDSWLDERIRPRIPSGPSPSSSSSSSSSSEDDYEHVTNPPTPSTLDWGEIHYLQNRTLALPFPPTPTHPTPRILTLHGVPQIPPLDPSPSTTLHAFQYPPDTNPYTTHPIPPSTDILITHSPPLHHCDLFPHSIGCAHLLAQVWRVRPSLLVFGHVHAAGGVVERGFYDCAQRSWEELCSRRCEKGEIWEKGERGVLGWVVRGGWWRDALDWRMWKGMVGVVFGAARAVVWTRVWGGETAGVGREGWIINAACKAESGLRGRGIVVEI
ncbi:hypothetical protein AJ80_10016 [Polytolypa hystricis UAMH7299]|uniref:Calcineurin-like phosphoesterase domain-containing protein n=1 Tax=Polytolypa hystricis (strain UAMH7299) TaxID=1447883 RepID=A0A2B7WF57_POLH7|nr:hypothetical protein AJ80_10016 [Polytolypa hystricis UAMH7299]